MHSWCTAAVLRTLIDTCTFMHMQANAREFASDAIAVQSDAALRVWVHIAAARPRAAAIKRSCT